MAPSRGKGKSRATAASERTASTRRSTRQHLRRHDDIPDIYQDMLDEVETTATTESPAMERPLKRRRVGRSVPNQQAEAASSPLPTRHESESDDSDDDGLHDSAPSHAAQTMEQSSEFDSDEDDLDFEDVDLDIPEPSTPNVDEEHEIADVSVAVDANVTPKRRAPPRRAPISRIEKAHRLLVHKVHFVCLLGSGMYVNSRCNNTIVHQRLRDLLSERVITFLNPRADDSQFGRNRAFLDGLRLAGETFRDAFTVTSSGMRKARWYTDGEELDMSHEPEPMDCTAFVHAAIKLEGSQDTGNQVFCALLRSVGVEARVVCSLQTLPLASVASQQRTPQKFSSPPIYLNPTTPTREVSNADGIDSSVRSSNAIGAVPTVRRRLGRPAFAASANAPSPVKKTRVSLRKLAYPVWWVEAFNSAHQKWVVADPLVTQTLNRPEKIEPPGSYSLNQLTYAIAFEASGVAKDVTLRYAKAYNAKTRRQRVESTENGAEWLQHALRPLRRRGVRLDRDQVEDADLTRREAREAMPANVQDFKGHPIYALERHLRRHEVLHPKREVGRMNSGTNAKPRIEPVYRRQDVLVCRSAQKWYLLGREMKPGQQPLKHLPARTRRDPDDDEDASAQATMTALYSFSQTELYVPPPVVNGRVPRNSFGNLDVYVSSMIPAGGSHIRDPFAQQAARALRIDYADAITGFQFKGRQGTPIVDGIVIAAKHADALRATIDGLADSRAEDASALRSLAALKLWKRFLLGLQIAQRIQSYGDGAMVSEARRLQDAAGRERAEAESSGGGGFLREPEAAGENEEPLLTAGKFSAHELRRAIKAGKKTKRQREETPEMDEEDEDEDHNAGGSSHHQTAAEEHSEGGFMRSNISQDEDRTGSEGGGFIQEDADMDDGGGGFFNEDTSGEHHGLGGGGFMLDETIYQHSQLGNGSGDGKDDEGGGFFPDETTTAEEEDGAGGGFVPAEDLLMSDEPPLPPSEETPQDEATVMEQAGPSSTHTSIPLRDGGKATSPETGSLELEEESDRGSLLSHDPDDDDAEPDWLESD